MAATFIALAIVAGLLVASWSLIAEAARGERWISLSRKSRQTPDAIWSRVEAAWDNTALTFEPVQVLPDSNETVKTFTLEVDAREFRTTLKRMPAGARHSLAITCLSANGQPFPLGRNHRKIWRVEPHGAGAVVRIAVTFNAPPGAIIQSIFTFRRQLRLICGA